LQSRGEYYKIKVILAYYGRAFGRIRTQSISAKEAGIMEKEILNEPNIQEELLAILRSPLSKEELNDSLRDYHEKDIADALEELTPEERQRLYPILGAEYVSEILTYVEDPDKYFAELNIESAAKILSEMDSDDAVDVLEELDDDVYVQVDYTMS